MSKRNQFRALAKRFLKDTMELFPKEEVHSDPEEKEEVPQKPSSDWKCEGYVWTEPPEPCKGGKKSDKKAGILHNNKRVVVCKECYNARDRMKNKERREQKKTEEPKKREKEEGEEQPSTPVKKGKVAK